MIIADTGFWLALANCKDRYHAIAKVVLAALDEPIVTTWPVLTETCHMLLQRLGNQAQQKLIKSYSDGAFEIFDLTCDATLHLQINQIRRFFSIPSKPHFQL